jgi:hypothetical protein
MAFANQIHILSNFEATLCDFKSSLTVYLDKKNVILFNYIKTKFEGKVPKNNIREQSEQLFPEVIKNYTFVG